jgi:hypothetical protein
LQLTIRTHREVPDEAKAVQLKVVREDEAKDVRIGGRPLFLSGRRFIKICRWIEQGESIGEACSALLTRRRPLVSRLPIGHGPENTRQSP